MTHISKDTIKQQTKDAFVKVGPGAGNTRRPVLDPQGTRYRNRQNGKKK